MCEEVQEVTFDFIKLRFPLATLSKQYQAQALMGLALFGSLKILIFLERVKGQVTDPPLHNTQSAGSSRACT